MHSHNDEPTNARPDRRPRRLPSVLVGVTLIAACAHPSSEADLATVMPDGGVTYVLPVPKTLGPGFTDITADVLLATRFAASPPNPNDVLWTADLVAGSFGDLDGDGLPEVVLTHFYGKSKDTSEIYRYDGMGHLARWQPDVLAPGMQVAAIVDLDGDGKNDILLGAPQQMVLWGVGAGAFSMPQSLQSGAAGLLNLASIYFDDFDSDGWLDVVAGVSCCPSGGATQCHGIHPILRTGARAFADRPGLVDEAPGVNLWALLATSLHDGEKTVGMLGLSCPNATGQTFYTQKGTDGSGYPHLVPHNPIEAAPAQPAYLSEMGPPMGSAVGDLDGDGVPELAVSLQYDHGLFQGQPMWPFKQVSTTSGYWRVPSDLGHAMIPWATAFLDVDRDGRLDALSVHGNDDAAFLQIHNPMVFIGPQQVTVHWNGGDLHFGDMTQATRLGRRGQWMSLAVSDLDGDGDPDLIVGGQVEMARVYRNDVDNGNHQLALRLDGSSSNHLGLGAKVDVTVAGLPVQHLMMAPHASRLVVSEPVLFAGLGPAAAADRVRITWPSGVVQELSNLAAGKLHRIAEPALFAIDPPDRIALADGKSHVTLTVTPRNADGSLRAGAIVKATLAAGTGTLEPSVEGAMGTTVQLDAPATPGFAVVQLTIDGIVVPLRPRITWK